MAKPFLRSRLSPQVFRDRLIYINFEKNPKPINVTTLMPTTAIADPKSPHPYHIRTVRRLEQFDPTKLHWSVGVPTELSKSAYIRKTAAKRVREAFRQELIRQGWNPDGQRRSEGSADGSVRASDLSGALKLGLTKDTFALTATGEDVTRSARWAVKTLSGLHDKEQQQRKPPGRPDTSRKGRGDHVGSVKTSDPPIRWKSHR